ncbi:MAG: hypothetical protein ACKOX2_06905 [Microcystaceae cyanobacterium]
MEFSANNHKLLGVLLQDAHLLSDIEIQIALVDQKAYGMRLGDILVLHGWVKKQTVDFFTEQWNKLLEGCLDYSLEDCLLAAGLLSDSQIKIIHQEQQLTGQDFGEIAVYRGWLKQSTLNFFHNHLTQQKFQAMSRRQAA